MTISAISLLPLVFLPYALNYWWDAFSGGVASPTGAVALLLGGALIWKKRYFPAVSLLTCGAGLLLRSQLPFVFYPAALSAVAGMTFLRTLGPRSTPLVEQLARRKKGSLPPVAVKYCRIVTILWGVALLINSGVSLFAWSVSESFWRLYNGGIFYGLLILLFALEYTARCIVRARYGAERPRDERVS